MVVTWEGGNCTCAAIFEVSEAKNLWRYLLERVQVALRLWRGAGRPSTRLRHEIDQKVFHLGLAAYPLRLEAKPWITKSLGLESIRALRALQASAHKGATSEW